jgi:hypothetical protein
MGWDHVMGPGSMLEGEDSPTYLSFLAIGPPPPEPYSIMGGWEASIGRATETMGTDRGWGWNH